MLLVGMLLVGMVLLRGVDGPRLAYREDAEDVQVLLAQRAEERARGDEDAIRRRAVPQYHRHHRIDHERARLAVVLLACGVVEHAHRGRARADRRRARAPNALEARRHRDERLDRLQHRLVLGGRYNVEEGAVDEID